MKKTTKNILKWSMAAAAAGSLLMLSNKDLILEASSHREAPMIANDPLADNTDLYAFRSPDDPSTVTIIANYVPFELPQGGPNYYSFGENIRYEVHIKNDAATVGDDITYRFTFSKTNQDPSTFFNIRLGKQNLKTTYKVEKIDKSGTTTIVEKGVVPPNNIGPRSITGAAGLAASSYEALWTATDSVVNLTNGGETVFCGPADDPFFVDLGGIFDLGATRGAGKGIDGLAKYNVHSIALKIPIKNLLKTGVSETPVNILDGNFVIGVWASASRPKIKTLNVNGTSTETGDWVQVSRIGMPLTNEAVIPVAMKDAWNASTPYAENHAYDKYHTNPELANYMDDSIYGGAVPAFADLRIQHKSLGSFDFGNLKNGVSALKNTPDTAGTAFHPFGDYLLSAGNPRSVDILPIFQVGVPNIPPYQLVTGKAGGNPLAKGKPFVNNFLPVFGDMLRLNMAVPVTPRNDPKFSSEGLLAAAVLGITDPLYNADATLQFIPNMDGFPNGRRLEDDVTRIELQAVSGVVLAAIGLSFDKADQLGKVLAFTAGVEANDAKFRATFPYLALPWSGYEHSGFAPGAGPVVTGIDNFGLGIGAPEMNVIQNYPNPFVKNTTIKYTVGTSSKVSLSVYTMSGSLVATLVDGSKSPGTYETSWNSGNLPAGIYVASLAANGKVVQSVKLNVVE